MKYVSLVMLVFILAGVLTFSSCRCMNRAAQSSDSQSAESASQQQSPDTLGGDQSQQSSQSDLSATQGNSNDTASASDPIKPLKIELTVIKYEEPDYGYDVYLSYSVNQKARITLTSIDLTGHSNMEIPPSIVEAGKYTRGISIFTLNHTGKGTITLTAEIPAIGIRERATVNYTVKPGSSYLGDINWHQ